MFRSRALQAALVGCLATVASFCALQARGGESYSIVAQSTRASAATGRRPLAERIAAANLPIIVQAAENTPLARTATPEPPENVAVAAVAIDEKELRSATGAAASRPDGKPVAPQSAVRAMWRAATGPRSGTVTR